MGYKFETLTKYGVKARITLEVLLVLYCTLLTLVYKVVAAACKFALVPVPLLTKYIKVQVGRRIGR